MSDLEERILLANGPGKRHSKPMFWGKHTPLWIYGALLVSGWSLCTVRLEAQEGRNPFDVGNRKQLGEGIEPAA